MKHEKDADLDAGPKPSDRHTTFFDDEMNDQLLRALVTVTMELSVTRERLDSIERILVRNNTMELRDLGDPTLSTADIETSRAAARAKLIEDVFGPLAEKLSGGR